MPGILFFIFASCEPLRAPFHVSHFVCQNVQEVSQYIVGLTCKVHSPAVEKARDVEIIHVSCKIYGTLFELRIVVHW